MEIQLDKQSKNLGLYMRMDSVLAKNAISFKRSFPYHGEMILDIVYFIAKKYQDLSFINLDYSNNLKNQLNPSQQEYSDYFTNSGLGNADPDIKFLFDPVEFANVMGYNRTYLWKRCLYPGYLLKHFGKKIQVPISTIESLTNINDLPYVLKIVRSISGFTADLKQLPKDNISAIKNNLSLLVLDHFSALYPYSLHFDSIIDDAIWRAANEKLTLAFHGEIKNYNYASTEGIDILSKAIKFQDSNRKNKVFYAFYINKSFLKNLSECFCITSTILISELRKNNCRYIAEYLLANRFAAMQNGNRFLVEFALAKELCNIDTPLPAFGDKGSAVSNARARIKLKITRKINKTLSIFNLINIKAQLKWEKTNTQKMYYTPVVVFEKSSLLSDVEQEMLLKRTKDEFYNRLYLAYVDAKNVVVSDNTMSEFRSWFKSPEDYGLKYKVHTDTLISLNPKGISSHTIAINFLVIFPQYKKY